MLQRHLGIAIREFVIPHDLRNDWPETAQSIALRVGHDAVYAQAESMKSCGIVPRTFIGRFDNEQVFRAANYGDSMKGTSSG